MGHQGLQAQNFVPNASFEQVAEDTKEKDIKTFGLVDAVTMEWAAPQTCPRPVHGP